MIRCPSCYEIDCRKCVDPPTADSPGWVGSALTALILGFYLVLPALFYGV